MVTLRMSIEERIKVPRRSNSSRVEKALLKTPQDGNWHRLLDMGMTTAEQTARAYNVPGGAWEFGYLLDTDNSGEIISALWVRWTK